MPRSRHSFNYETSQDRRNRFSEEGRGYRDPGVLLGYWFEERARAEAETEELLEKYCRGRLEFQKLDAYLNHVSVPLDLTRNLDGFLHHGDIVRLNWTGEEGKCLFLAALPWTTDGNGVFGDPCLALGTEDTRILLRSAFYVFRNNNNIPNHVPLRYGDIIQICTLESAGPKFLYCESNSLKNFTRKSNHQEVSWKNELCGRSLWKVLSEDAKDRLKTEGRYIPVNTNVIISHVASGQHLALEKDSVTETVFGPEKEISCHTFMDARKMEGMENKWQFEAALIKPDDFGEPMAIPRCSLSKIRS